MRTRNPRAIVPSILAILLVATPVYASSSDPWIFEGGGWGHGIGLSQYGSQGMALDGYSVNQIIDFYFNGANVEHMAVVDGAEDWLDDPEAIWVGLSKSQSARSFEAIGNDIDVCHRGDGTDDCSTADLTLTDGQVLNISVVSTGPLRCERSVDGGPSTEGDCWVDITWDDDPENRRVAYGIHEYARGSLRVRPNDVDEMNDATLFHVAVSLDLEHYLYGVSETLLHWEQAALQTQAVIARSYGVSNAMNEADSSGGLWITSRQDCWCHLSDSPAVDQNYDGWDVDNEGSGTYGQDWRDAVDATAGEVVTHPQVGSTPGETVVSTFYSSSNGGASEDNEDVWGGSPQPHLRSVVDPWSSDPNVNPLATWTVLVDDDDIAAYLGWDQVLDAIILEGPPGVQVKFTGNDGGAAVSTTLNGTAIRLLLNTIGYKDGGGSVKVSPYISAVIDPPGFDDIHGNVFENAINWLRDEQITLGCNPPDNTLFCPFGEVTRGEMAVFISRAANLPVPSDDYFTDDDGKFWEGGANRMFEAGISVGCGGTKYCGHHLLPREQMAVFLVRALNLPPTQVDYFTDDENSPFEDHINRIAEANITLGCNPPANTHFCPNDTVTRGQMSAFFKRAWGP